uniref:Protein male-specific lethal-3 n=1 Tax=Hirondellea gigas TaxID=1518452 RepID=A0A2P2I621_9CRUS
MVSTRGVKARFCEGERVLCYEPDPTKAKVLYESKVLQLVYNKDVSRGKKQLEYLIHFQGWNASWDRCVDEDLVLKDTEENRDLQKRLMENAHIKLKEKKKKRRLSDTIREIVLGREKNKKEKSGSDTASQGDGAATDDEDGGTSDASSNTGCTAAHGSSVSSSSVAPAPVEQQQQQHSVSSSSSSNTVAATAAPVVTGADAYLKEYPIDIPASLKLVLERDFYLIKEKRKLLQLPCPPAALTVLENYVQFFATRYLARSSERRRNETKLKDKAYLTLDLCKEVMDGVRVCFDFHCNTHLLYIEEQQQATTLATVLPSHVTDGDVSTPVNGHRVASSSSNVKDEDKSKFMEEKTKMCSSSSSTGGGGGEDTSAGRRLTRSAGRPSLTTDAAATASDSGRSTPATTASSGGSNCQQQQQAPVAEKQQESTVVLASLCHLSEQLSSWTLLPHVHRIAGTATLVYGPLHLLRLFVKLPEILYRMNLAPEKRKIIVKHLQLFIEYLDVHNQDFFSEDHYISSSA